MSRRISARFTFSSARTALGSPDFSTSSSALANLPEDESLLPIGTWVKRVLMEGVERIVLSAKAMRAPLPPGAPTRFQPDGSNLPCAIDRLARFDPDRFQRWVEHVRTALPDLTGIQTIERPEDRHRYLVMEYADGLKAPSWVVSDGTLRLLALTLLAYLPEAGRVALIEEPENGIHPRAIELAIALLTRDALCFGHSGAGRHVVVAFSR